MNLIWSILGLVVSVYAPVVSHISEPAIPITSNVYYAEVAKTSKVEIKVDEAYAPNEDDDYVAQTGTKISESILDNVSTSQSAETSLSQELYEVVNVVDGDTLDVSINGKIERLRLIGINTPETVDPRRPVQCFGVQASNKAKEFLSGKSIALESDPTQGERDKYDRLLRYIHLSDGRNFNELMISEGYAYEYTYDLPYKYQQEFKQAEADARQSGRGLWAEGVCTDSTSDASTSTCSIKGNISVTGEKIYHVIGCAYYNKTNISEDEGEKWFCSGEEAEAAGWRKAKNC